MPVKRALQLEENEHTPLKTHSSDKNGTKDARLTATTQDHCEANVKNGFPNSLGIKESQAEVERMLFFRSQVEGSIDALIKTRKQLETLVPVEGNSELRSFLLMSPADLQTELMRHKELTSKMRCEHTAEMHEDCLQGVIQTGSSYEFLKEILRG